MSLLQIEGTLEEINKVRALPGLKVFLSTIEDIGAGRYRISAEAPEEMFAEIGRTGCEVLVAMSAQDIDRFHGEVTSALALQDETPREQDDPPAGLET